MATGLGVSGTQRSGPHCPETRGDPAGAKACGITEQSHSHERQGVNIAVRSPRGPCTGRGFLLPSRCLREGLVRYPRFADAETETQGGTALPKVTCLEAAEPDPVPPTHNKVASSCLGPSPGVSSVSGLVTTCPCHSGRVSGLALTAPRASESPPRTLPPAVEGAG